ncbi:MAG TPA: MJ0042-type zinc finger domain-containing protein [Myxococcales bacterium]|jgi:predicted Zn finger-like uncharacterized protein|nr:MJ0042-type zinc finger domain-containing protein [Myxococcales bacterium]
MLVRCERCRAAFTVQDGLAVPGFRVECGRCLLVFSPRLSTPERDGPALVVKAVPPKPQRQWKGPLSALLLLAVAAAAFGFWRLRNPRVSKAAAARIAQGDALLLKDDLASLDGAVQLFTEAAHLAPRAALPEARRAFALLLQSATEKALDNPDSTRLLQQGIAAAKAAIAESPRDPAARQAVALAYLLSGSPQEAAPFMQSNDLWSNYLRAVGDAKALEQVALVRAEVDEARLLMPASPQRAQEILARVLQENPRHELARSLAK